MLKGLTIRQVGMFMVTTPVLLSLVFTWFLINALQDAEHDLKNQIKGAKLAAVCGNLQAQAFNAAMKGSLWHSNKSRDAFKSLDTSLASIQKSESELQELLKDDEKQKFALENTIADFGQARKFLIEVRNGSSTEFGGNLDPRIFHKQGFIYMNSINDDLNALNDYAIVLQKSSVENSRSGVITTIAGGAILSICLAVAFAYFFSRFISGRLAIVRDNAVLLAAGKPLQKRLEGEDEVAQLDTAFHDMAEALEEANSKQLALVDNAADVLCSLDEKLTIQRVSPACQRVWGFTPEEVEGLKLVELLEKETSVKTIKEAEEHIRSKSQGTFDARLVRKDSRVIDVLVSSFWSAKERALFCVVRDVTREREFERIKQKLMDTVAHDLRSPIASIRAVLESLALGVLGPLSDNAVKRIRGAESSADRLLRLINDLLDYDKFESGHFSLLIDEHSIQEIAYSSIVSIESLIDSKNIITKVEGEDCIIKGDSDRLQQAMINILSNAVKFSPEGGQITITTSKRNSTCLLELADQGPGIPDSYKSQVFERFKQVESDTHKHKGTGLGLPISQQIIEAHEGQIGVKDNPEGGTIFWFTVPLAIEPGNKLQ